MYSLAKIQVPKSNGKFPSAINQRVRIRSDVKATNEPNSSLFVHAGSQGFIVKILDSVSSWQNFECEVIIDHDLDKSAWLFYFHELELLED